MKRSHASLGLAGLALTASALALGWPAFGQGGQPESLLPPGFGDPPPPAAAPSPPPGTDAAVAGVAEAEVPAILPVPAEAAPTPEELAAAEEARAADELPPEARRPIALVGVEMDRFGFEGDAFGTADGRFLTGLMRRLDAPVASRWASITLRRALMSPVVAPRQSEPADWVAERAALLLRMGEADAARMLVQAVDADRYSKRLFDVALQTAEATSDPVALCAIADRGAAVSKAAEWPLARAICAGLAGDSATAGAILDAARADRSAGGVDLLLAEKLAAAGTNDRRNIGINWRSVRTLTPWRFGMGNAAFVPFAPGMLDGAGRTMRAWAARTPAIPYSARIEPARTAAVMGVFSNAALVDLYSTLGDDADPAATDDSATGRLRRAYVAATPGERMTALRTFWTDVAGDDRYANAILVARAAARIDPDAAHAGDLGDLLSAMFAAGLDRYAARWAALVPDGAGGDLAYGLLSVGAPRPIALQVERIEEMNDRRRAQLIVAGLAGLGRLGEDERATLDKATGAGLARRDGWTRAIDRAAALRQPGTVALLAAVGMQTEGWGGVPAAYLYHVVAALRAVGREAEARMIAAEALSRTG